jgi:nucleotide-binding universal stress UspA family protein
MILISYDGSEDAKAAIDRAASLTPGREATVLTVWERLADVLARTGASFAGGGAISDAEEVDRESEEAAKQTAEEGAERASAAGLKARATTRPRDGSIDAAILEEGDALDAEAIVLGTRGLTGVKSILLGSVSHAVVQHADRPVLVAPSAAVAERRVEHRRSV